jgi:nucleotide-binding universal stress UspA family protein
MAVQHILVPTDFSEDADQALNDAIELAHTLQARLTLLHAIYLAATAVGSLLAYSLEGYLQAMEAEAREHLQTLLKRVHQAGLQGEAVMIHDVPFQAILDAAKDKDVDLIVMGTHGRTGLTHALMGSVAERVVRMAPCPVLVTRGTTSSLPRDRPNQLD